MQRFNFLFLILFATSVVAAETPVALGSMANANASVAESMVVRYIGSNPGVKEEYYVDLIRMAMQITEPSFGPYRVDFSEVLMNAKVKNEMLARAEKLNVVRMTGFDSIAHPGKGNLKIDVPLLEGFLGLRIPLIRRVAQPDFAKIHTANDLRKMQMGMGQGWEGYLYRQNGFVVTEALNMTVLLKMLVAKRFDFVPLGATEIDEHYLVENQSVDVLMPESHLLIYMPTPTFFYVSPKFPELAKRLTEGLKKMQADGQMKKIFNKYYAERLKKLNLANRTIIEIPNPEDDDSVEKMNFKVLKEY
jgi:ABC-type amino acid transport substrate-binding protein